MKIFGYWAISNSASDGCGSHFSKWPTAVTVMILYLLYWRGMQVDLERLFNNEGPVMVKESNNFQKCLLRGQYLAIKVT